MTGSIISSLVNQAGETLSAANARFTIDCFPGFHSAMQVCEALQNMEIRGIPLEPGQSCMRWPEQMVDLLPEQLPLTPKKKVKKKVRHNFKT